MKVYIDTGIFIDYLSEQALGGASLRSGPRRGRMPAQLQKDAVAVLARISESHVGGTSCLTYYEVEEALHKVWESHAKGVTNASTIRVMAARSIMPQVGLVVQFFNILPLDLTAIIVSEQLRNQQLLISGIRSADSLHVCTAAAFDADVLLAADDDLLKLDNKILNSKGTLIRCIDSDAALSLL